MTWSSNFKAQKLNDLETYLKKLEPGQAFNLPTVILTLLSEIKKLHRKIEKLEEKVSDLE